MLPNYDKEASDRAESPMQATAAATSSGPTETAASARLSHYLSEEHKESGLRRHLWPLAAPTPLGRHCWRGGAGTACSSSLAKSSVGRYETAGLMQAEKQPEGTDDGEDKPSDIAVRKL